VLIKDYHSGNKVDYYDTANYGVDTGIVFNRADNGAFLKYWEFYTVKDAFTANQDIANYVGGVLLVAANPMIELNDKHKILKAGFDFKTSFRKAKQKS